MNGTTAKPKQATELEKKNVRLHAGLKGWRKIIFFTCKHNMFTSSQMTCIPTEIYSKVSTESTQQNSTHWSFHNSILLSLSQIQNASFKKSEWTHFLSQTHTYGYTMAIKKMSYYFTSPLFFASVSYTSSRHILTTNTSASSSRTWKHQTQKEQMRSFCH